MTMSRTAALTWLCLSGTASADTLVHNVNGYTWSEGEIVGFSELLIDDAGRVVATGETGTFDGVDTERVDGAGATMLPGLIDAHAHPLALGRLRRQVDLSGAHSLENALERVQDYHWTQPDAVWILGRGWNQELWPERAFPNAAALDEIVAERPVWLRRVDGHAGWANSRAMQLAGIDANGTKTQAPPGGEIHRDATGAATGIFVDKAMELITAVIPEPTRDEDLAALRTALSELNRYGLTGVHDTGVTHETVALYKDLADDDQLNVRVYVMLADEEETLNAFDEPFVGYGDERLDVRSVKLYTDGALGSRGAALLEPYDDAPDSSGLLFAERDALISKIAAANAKGFQVGVHAIGDRANRVTLDAFESVQGDAPSQLRNRIEHAQVVSLEDIPRFAELGLIASMQLTHATSDKNMAEDRVGPERIRGAYAWQRFLESGVVLAAGSDFPVEATNPFWGIYSGVTRQDHRGEPAGGWYPEQRLSIAEALHAFTLGAAYAGHAEDSLGSLEPGKWADFVLIDRDPFTGDPSELWQTIVLETWLAGEPVYRRHR